MDSTLDLIASFPDSPNGDVALGVQTLSQTVEQTAEGIVGDEHVAPDVRPELGTGAHPMLMHHKVDQESVLECPEADLSTSLKHSFLVINVDLKAAKQDDASKLSVTSAGCKNRDIPHVYFLQWREPTKACGCLRVLSTRVDFGLGSFATLFDN